MSAAPHELVRSHALPGVTALALDSARHYGRHTHDQYGIGLILAGAQRSASGRGPVVAGAGELITVNPGEVHDGIPLTGARRWQMLYLDVELLRDDDGRLREFTAPVARDVRAAGLFARLYTCLREPGAQGGQLAPQSLLLALRARLGACSGAAADAARIDGAALAPARARIDADPAAQHRLDALAQACGLSRYAFLRAFARLTGLTPHAYVQQQRLHLARRLLARGEPVAQAAADAGFADQSHLTRLFVRDYGVTPARYGRAAPPR